VKLLYFAWLKTKTGCAEEDVELPKEVSTVAELVAWLKQRSPGHAAALEDEKAIRIAINQSYAKPGDKVGDSDEVALFPPVTGG
jgi:molybdopterin synthase sulfur carrier subunit